MQLLPQTRNTDIITQEIGNEILVYDLITNKAYSLNETSALIYRQCDGTTTFEEVKRTSRQLTDDIIYLTLDELKRNNLIDEEYQSKFAGISRRKVIKRVGLASMVALPIITSLIAPTAAEAQSSSCTCPVTEPTRCRTGGFYLLGCFATNADCLNAAMVSAGTAAAPNHCCLGISTATYDRTCCTVVCNN